MTKPTSKTQLLTRVTWISFVAIFLLLYLLFPNAFTKESLANFISEYGVYSWAIYFLIHLLRGLVLLPSTPLVFAGIILFSSQPTLLLTITVLGIVGSSVIIYFFSEKLGLDKHFKESKKLGVVKEKLLSKNGYLYIIGWSFFPFVPTDIICYLAGIIKINLTIFIVSLLLGELVLCSFYIYGGASIIN
jgi:uncharacterized membrane protein YdjX (TVP38/TMEM64 family)